MSGFPIDLSSHQVTGSLYPGKPVFEVPNAVTMVLQDVANACWELGNAKSAGVAVKSQDLQDALQDLFDTVALNISAGTVSVPTVTAPSVIIPSTVDTSDIINTFRTEYVDLANYLVGKYANFITTYFPNESALYSAAESSLSAALASNSFIPAAVQAQIIGDADAIVIEDKLKAQDAVVAMYQARRFPLPPDVAAAAVLQIEQKAQDQMAETARKIAIMSVEQYKWTIEKCINLRTVALSSAGDYVKAAASGPEIASRVTGIGYDAQSKLISSAAQFYGADTNAKEMMSKVDQFNKTITLTADEKNQMAQLTLIDDKVKAMLADIAALRHETAALYNNVHLSVGLSSNGQTQLSLSGDV